jgi:hypothetical protein
MNKLLKWFVCSLMVINLTPLAWGGSDRAVAADAVKTIEKVSEFLMKNGKEKNLRK